MYTTAGFLFVLLHLRHNIYHHGQLTLSGLHLYYSFIPVKLYTMLEILYTMYCAQCIINVYNGCLFFVFFHLSDNIFHHGQLTLRSLHLYFSFIPVKLYTMLEILYTMYCAQCIINVNNGCLFFVFFHLGHILHYGQLILLGLHLYNIFIPRKYVHNVKRIVCNVKTYLHNVKKFTH